MQIVLLQKSYLFGKIKSFCEMLNPFGDESKTKLMKLRQPHLVFIVNIVFKVDIPCFNILTDVSKNLSTDWWLLSVKLFIQNQNPRMRAMKMCQWFSYLSSKGNNLYSIIIYVYIFKWIAIWRVIDLAFDTHMDDLFELKSNYV